MKRLLAVGLFACFAAGIYADTLTVPLCEDAPPSCQTKVEKDNLQNGPISAKEALWYNSRLNQVLQNKRQQAEIKVSTGVTQVLNLRVSQREDQLKAWITITCPSGYTQCGLRACCSAGATDPFLP